jgi:hypothetical protein
MMVFRDRFCLKLIHYNSTGVEALYFSFLVKAGSVSNCHHVSTTKAYADATIAVITAQVSIKQRVVNECFLSVKHISWSTTGLASWPSET